MCPECQTMKGKIQLRWDSTGGALYECECYSCGRQYVMLAFRTMDPVNTWKDVANIAIVNAKIEPKHASAHR